MVKKSCLTLVLCGVLLATSTNALLLNWSTYLGGNTEEQFRDVTTDAQGNIYLTGGTSSPNFVTTSGAADRTQNGMYDAFVAKFSSSGQLLWSTFVGGPEYDRAYAIELSPQGDVIIAGRAGSGLPALTGSFDSTFAGGTSSYGPQDGFVCKIKADGTQVLFCGYLGTADPYIVRDVAVDDVGNMYLFHLVTMSGIPAAWTANGYTQTYSGGVENLILKISPDGKQVLGGTYFGGSGDEGATGSVRWHNGNVYIASLTHSTDLPMKNAYDNTLGGPGDDYLAVFSDDLQTLVFSTYVGGSTGDDVETHNLIVDNVGNAYVSAGTTSIDFPTTSGAYDTSFNGGNQDAFVIKFSPTGSLLASTLFGGSGTEFFQGIAIDPSTGNFVGAISTSSTDLPTTSPLLGSYAAQSAGVAVFTPDLTTLVFSQLLSGNDDDTGRAAWVAPDGSVTIAGTSGSTNFPMKNPYQSALSGTSDGIVMHFKTNSASQICGNSVIEGSEACDNGAQNGVCPATCSTSCTTNNCGGGDTTPPVATITTPTNNQIFPSGTTTTPVTVTTNEPATCRRSATDVAYSSMLSANTLTGSGTTSHSGTLSTFVDGGTYTRYIRCIDAASNAMPSSASVTFSISSTPPPKTGDLNSDGIVNIIDVQLVVNKLGQRNVTTGEDLNADSRVDIFDLVTLARYWG